MKKILLLLAVCCLPFMVEAQKTKGNIDKPLNEHMPTVTDFEVKSIIEKATLPLTEDFESDSYTSWKSLHESTADPQLNDLGRNENYTSFGGAYNWMFDSRQENSDGVYNQYLISPELSVSATGNKGISFYTTEFNMSDQQYAVGYSITTDDISSFTWLDTQTISVFLGMNWIQYTNNTMPSEAKYIAIKYISESQNNFLLVDNIEIYEVADPIPGISSDSWNAGNIIVGEQAQSYDFKLINAGAGTLTVNNATSLSAPWSTSFDKNEVSLNSGEEYTFTFNVTPTEAGLIEETFIIEADFGNITIGLTANGIECQSVALPLEQGFEGDSYQCWSAVLGNPLNGNNFGLSDIRQYDGEFCWVFSSWDNVAGGNYNQYLTTPELPATTEDINIEFYYINIYLTTAMFRVGYSSTTNNVLDGTSFTWLATEEVERDESWILYSARIPSGSKYIAINYCPPSDQYHFYIDNIKIEELSSSGIDKQPVSNDVAIYPNPAKEQVNVRVAETSKVKVIDAYGRILSTYDIQAGQTLSFTQPAGIYFIQIEGNGKSETRKVIVK